MQNEERIDLDKITDEQVEVLHSNFKTCCRSLASSYVNFIKEDLNTLNLNDLNDLMVLQNIVNDAKDMTHSLDLLYTAMSRVAVIKMLNGIKFQ